MSLSPIHHVSISVTDLERSVAFYRDVLGLRVTMEGTVGDEQHEIYLRLPAGTSARVAILQADERPLGAVELIEWSLPSTPRPPNRPGDPGVFLLAFDVVDETSDAARARLERAGARFWSDIQTMTIDGYGDIRAVVFEDPDGLMLELLELPDPDAVRAARRRLRSGTPDQR